MSRTILLIFLLISTASLIAQQRFSIGIKAGVAMPFDRTSEFKPFETMVAPSVGISAQYDLFSMLTIDLSALYDGKGVKRPYYVATDSTVSQAFTKHSNYLSVPLTAKMKIGKKHKVIIGVGGFMGYLVLEDVFDANKSKSQSNLLDFENRLDLGLTFTFGAEFRLGQNLILSIDPSFDLGLYDTSPYPSINREDQNTTSPKIHVGLHYKL